MSLLGGPRIRRRAVIGAAVGLALASLGGLWTGLPWAQTGTPTPATTPRATARPSRTPTPSPTANRSRQTPTSLSRTSKRIDELSPSSANPYLRQKAPLTPTPGQGGAPPASAPNVVRRPQQTPKPVSGRAPSGGRGKSGLALAQVPSSNVLYLEPMEKSLRVGEEFNATIVYVNNRRESVDSARIVLQYDPRALMPLGAVKDPIDEYLASPEAFRAFVYGDEGLIVIEESFGLPTPMSRMELARIRWKAMAPTTLTSVSFVTNGERSTGVYAGSKLALGDPALDTAGVVGADYQVLAAENAGSGAAAPLTEDMTADAYRRAYGYGEEAAIALRLCAPTSPIKLGQRFFVDVIMENPGAARLDVLNLVIHFDPAILQVEDYDEGNWIAAGLNIFDGAYHDRYPFDMHIRNQAYNSLGEIHYMMGTSRPETVFPTGKLASILFAAVAPASPAEIRFHVAQDSTENGTVASFLGRSVLPPGASALANATVEILP